MSLAASSVRPMLRAMAIYVLAVCLAASLDMPNRWMEVAENSSILYAMEPNAVSTTFCTSTMSLPSSTACFPREIKPLITAATLMATPSLASAVPSPPILPSASVAASPICEIDLPDCSPAFVASLRSDLSDFLNPSVFIPVSNTIFPSAMVHLLSRYQDFPMISRRKDSSSDVYFCLKSTNSRCSWYHLRSALSRGLPFARSSRIRTICANRQSPIS